MKNIYTNNRYGSGDGPVILPEYDYLLFTQDWSGNEAIYFNADELDDFAGMLNSGEIKLHPHYSILYCKTLVFLEEVKGEFGCQELLMPKS